MKNKNSNSPEIKTEPEIKIEPEIKTEPEIKIEPEIHINLMEIANGYEATSLINEHEEKARRIYQDRKRMGVESKSTKTERKRYFDEPEVNYEMFEMITPKE